MEHGIEATAQALLRGEDSRTTRLPLTHDWPDLDADVAYRVQDTALELRRARGERITGVKLGLTSTAKQRAMNVAQPLTAWLTHPMELSAVAGVPWERLIHPRAEPEIVFEMGKSLSGPGVTADEALAAVRAVRPGIEIIDSRYHGYQFRLPDVIADNASSAAYLLGQATVVPSAHALATEECSIERGGRTAHRGVGADVHGGPAEALAFAANQLARRGLGIAEGWLVMTGGVTDAVPLVRGETVTARFSSLATLRLTA